MLQEMVNSDEYSHDDPNIYYISESIPFGLNKNDKESEDITLEFNTQLAGCTCDGDCSSGCSCIRISGPQTPEQDRDKIRYQYITVNGEESVLTDCIIGSDQPVYECNSACSCNLNCGNRLVQYGPRKGLEIFMNPKVSINNATFSKGLGVSTTIDIPRGGFICEYAGEIISKSESINRHRTYDKNNEMNYIICLNEITNNRKIQTFIDPSKFGNIGRYLNHSCEPNCVMIPIRVNTLIPKLCIFALKSITNGTELTFDYGNIKTDQHKSINIHNLKPCLCESVNCRIWLPNFEYDIDLADE